MSLTFEWDSEKSTSNLRKHGVAFEDASTVFSDTLSITIDDPAHSKKETRCITIGNSISGKILVVVHTERGDNIRIISAREASKKERKQYEG